MAKLSFPRKFAPLVQFENLVQLHHVGEAFRFIQRSSCSFELRERQLTPIGRAKLRERVAVEHSLSHIGRWQGEQARYVGGRKNLFDLRRTAVVHNLHVLAKIFTTPTEPSSASI